jgi:uncharacterized protein involved in exopolysaccharide biosynthesis
MIREVPARDVTVLEPPPLPPGPAEPTLADYLAQLWRAKIFLVAVAILAGAAMFALSLSGPRVYESTVTFAVTQSKIGEGTQAIAGTASFRPMVESLSTAAAVMREVGLDKPPNAMRPSDFLENVMSVSEVRGTNLMRVTVVHTEPQMAATMANSIAKHAVDVARTVSAREAEHARDMIGKQVTEARRRLDEADTKLRTFKKAAQIEAVKKDVEGQLTGRLGILDLLVSIASERAKLASMEQQLKDRSRIDTVNRTESLNKVYEDLDTEAATTRSYLASLEKQKTELVDVRKLNASNLAALNRLYELEGELARLEVEYDLAEKIYMEISQRYEEASLQVVGRSAELSVIDPAVPADRPVSRHVVRNTAVAGIIGFCFAVALVLLWNATKNVRRAPALAR